MSERRAKVLRWTLALLRRQLQEEHDPEVRRLWVTVWVQTAPRCERRMMRRALQGAV